MAEVKEMTLRCYRGACNAPAHPCGYNRVTQALYCLSCAIEINRHSIYTDAPGGPFFPLLAYKIEIRKSRGGAFVPGTIRVRMTHEEE